MIKDKKYYQSPDVSVTRLCAESIVCLSNLGAYIVVTEEKEDEGGDWTPIY